MGTGDILSRSHLPTDRIFLSTPPTNDSTPLRPAPSTLPQPWVPVGQIRTSSERPDQCHTADSTVPEPCPATKPTGS